MMSILETENNRVSRLRKICLACWGLGLLLPLGILGTFYSQLAVMGAGAEPPWAIYVYVLSPLLTTLGAIFLVAALLTTVAWFFRSRSVSLAEIELRLAHLEQLLSSQLQKNADR